MIKRILAVAVVCQVVLMVSEIAGFEVIESTGLLGVPVYEVIAVVVSMMALITAGVVAWSLRAVINQWPLALVVGGFLSNVGERVLFACVADYWWLGGFAVNAADVCIVVGGVWMVILLRRRIKESGNGCYSG